MDSINKKTPKITLLGSNSGRNAGDAAIMAAIMAAITKELGPNVEFEVPTTNPKHVAKYQENFNVRPINVMPWTGSIRLFGLTTFASVKRSDLTFITNGIIFDIKLFNPLFNFLITLIFIVPWAKLWGKKIICYNVGIGPLNTFWGKIFARYVGDNSDLITCRDSDSIDLFRKIGVRKKIHLTADAVFQNWSVDDARVDQIMSSEQLGSENLLGFNVTKYVDEWLGDNQKVRSKEEFLNILAESLVDLKIRRNIESVIFITHIMDVDYGLALKNRIAEIYLKKTAKNWSPKIISNKKYNNHELQGLAKRFNLFLGMRVHSLIINAQAGTPVVGLVYAPKVRSFLKLLGTEELALELNQLTSNALSACIEDAWLRKEEVRTAQQAIAKVLQNRALSAAKMIKERYYSDTRPVGSEVAKAVVNS